MLVECSIQRNYICGTTNPEMAECPRTLSMLSLSRCGAHNLYPNGSSNLSGTVHLTSQTAASLPPTTDTAASQPQANEASKVPNGPTLQTPLSDYGWTVMSELLLAQHRGYRPIATITMATDSGASDFWKPVHQSSVLFRLYINN